MRREQQLGRNNESGCTDQEEASLRLCLPRASGLGHLGGEAGGREGKGRGKRECKRRRQVCKSATSYNNTWATTTMLSRSWLKWLKRTGSMPTQVGWRMDVLSEGVNGWCTGTEH